MHSMKLDKAIVQRRVDLMAAEGIVRIMLSWITLFPLNAFYRRLFPTPTSALTSMSRTCVPRTMLSFCVLERLGRATSRFPTARLTASTSRWNISRYVSARVLPIDDSSSGPRVAQHRVASGFEPRRRQAHQREGQGRYRHRGRGYRQRLHRNSNASRRQVGDKLRTAAQATGITRERQPLATVAEVSRVSPLSETRADRLCRIFRTDYGHTEVAAHFGNGKRHAAPVSRLRFLFFRDEQILASIASPRRTSWLTTRASSRA